MRDIHKVDVGGVCAEAVFVCRWLRRRSDPFSLQSMDVFRPFDLLASEQ